MLVKDRWFHFSQPVSAPSLRLFCFPYAGGGASAFRNWQPRLPAGVEVCAIQLPGRETRFKDPPYTRLSDLAPVLAKAFVPYTDVPFVFFGHSMGALVAFTLARELRTSQLPHPVHLMVSAHRAPQQPDSDPSIHDLPEEQFIEKIRELNGTPDAIFKNRELMGLLLPVLRADFAVCETYEYVPEPPLECPISGFGGIDDSEVSRDDIAAWRHQTSGVHTLNMFPGGHFYLLDEPTALFSHLSFQLRGIMERERKGLVRG